MLFCDISAALLGFALLSLLLYASKRSVGYQDEAFYLSIPQRFLQGDLLLAHDWSVEQLASLFLIIPYKLYVTFAGGTEGIILAFRYFFVVVDLLFYVYMYLKLRRYGACGVLSAFFFCSVIPATGLVLNYHTISAFAVMQVCLILFTGDKKKNLVQFILAGVIWAFGILAEPLLIFTYILYCIVFLLSKTAFGKKTLVFPDKQTDILSGKAFGFISLGGWIIFFAFILFFWKTGTLALLGKTFPYLISDKGYSPSDILQASKLTNNLGEAFGWVSVVLYIVCLGLAIRFRVKNYKSEQERQYRRNCLFALSCVALVCACGRASVFAHIAYQEDMNTLIGHFSPGFDYLLVLSFHELPILMFPPIWFLLLRNKDNRILTFWLVAFMYSVCVDISSDWLFGIGGRIAIIPALLSLKELIGEIQIDNTNKKGKTPKNQRSLPIARIAGYVCAAVVLFWNFGYVYTVGFIPMQEKIHGRATAPLSAEIQSGPSKGLLTTEEIRDTYEASLRDIRNIEEQNTERLPLLVYEIYPTAYLYTDMPYGATTAYYALESQRAADYWTLFPEKQPKYVYIPYFQASTGFYIKTEEYFNKPFEFFDENADYTIAEGEAGYILTIHSFSFAGQE